MDVGVVKPFASKVPRPRKGPDYDKAKHFLLDDKTDFLIVCRLAEVNPAAIRACAARIDEFAAQMVWRYCPISPSIDPM
jgi:hypothetical protein